MKTITRLFIVLVLLQGVSLSAQARGRGHGHGFMKEMMKELNLSEEQKTKLKDMRKKQKGEMEALRQGQRQLRNKLKQAFANGASDDELKKIHKELMQSRNKVGEKRFEKVLSIRQVLTAEQRKKFDKMKAEKMEKRKHRKRHSEEKDD